MIIIITIYLFLYLYIIIFDLMPIPKDEYKVLYVFNSITLFLSFLIVVLVGLDLKVPNPSNLIQYIVQLFIA